MLRGLITACLVWVLLAVPASASGIALFIVNERYEDLRGARGADEVLRVQRRLEAAGFDTDQATDVSAPAMRAALSAFDQRIARERPERVMIVFAGYALHDRNTTWLLGAEAAEPALANLDGIGLRLETVLNIAGRVQGGAVVALADLGYPERLAAPLAQGLAPALDVPQGVSVLRGPAGQLASALEALVSPGTTPGAAAARVRQVEAEGFNPPYLAFLPEGHVPSLAAERRAWQAAEEEGTPAAYRAYLADWPEGLFVEDARAGIERLENTPERIEEALVLTREERRAVQRDLTILNFNPRGIDGIFGPGSRAAIGSWQRANGHEQTGFLIRDQIHQLAGQASRRAAELEAEARERQAAEERQDRAYWRDTGAGRDEAGLRAYLERFPDGVFSNIARERLDEIEAARREAAQARDRAAWDVARRADIVPAYEVYLREYPRGAFVEDARNRIDALTRPVRPRPDIEAARAGEEAMMLPRFTLMIIEQRLAGQGFEPGAVDGRLDADTRRAIRRYQRAADLPVTGYLTEGIVARLMADSVFQLFD
ncbi:MAG TPA: peptidoglycan-binding protein [Paracoccus sp.]|nr:peptidoglycan-binding protein [Paracoccus sp. (in: a-proteobacteria)]